MDELETLVAKIARENQKAEAAVPGFTAEKAASHAAFLKKWSKGKPIVRQTSDSTFWAAGKWMTKLTASQAESLVAHGYATLSGKATAAGARLMIIMT